MIDPPEDTVTPQCSQLNTIFVRCIFDLDERFLRHSLNVLCPLESHILHTIRFYIRVVNLVFFIKCKYVQLYYVKLHQQQSFHSFSS